MTARSLRRSVPSVAFAVMLIVGCGDPSTNPPATELRGTELRGTETRGTEPAATEPGASAVPDTTTTDPPAVALPEALEGRTFLASDVTGVTLVPGTSVTLSVRRFDGKPPQLSLSGGCNEQAGPLSVEDGRLVMSSVSSTEMGCGPALHAQDEMFRALLFERPTIALDGDTLVITGDTITLTLVDQEVADPDRPLLGTTWTINTIITEMWASTTPAAATLLFEDAVVIVDTGCNTGSAPITIDGTTITFGTLTLTEIACDEELMAFEAHIAATLSGSRTIEITAGSLRLIDPTSGAGLGAYGG